MRVDGGYRIDGGWDYGSGCDTATHFIGGIAVAGADGEAPADTRWAAFPRAAYAIVDNWDTLGMRGTGSRARRGRGRLRPRAPHRGLAQPRPPRRGVPGPRRARESDLPRRDDHAAARLRAAAVAVGIAQGAIDHYIEVLQTRRQYGPKTPLRRELTMFQRDLGQATALVDTAEAALMQVATTWTEQAHGVVESGVEVSDGDQRRLLLVCQQVVELCAEAVDVVFRTAGTTATRRARPSSAAFATST